MLVSAQRCVASCSRTRIALRGEPFQAKPAATAAPAAPLTAAPAADAVVLKRSLLLPLADDADLSSSPDYSRKSAATPAGGGDGVRQGGAGAPLVFWVSEAVVSGKREAVVSGKLSSSCTPAIDNFLPPHRNLYPPSPDSRACICFR